MDSGVFAAHSGGGRLALPSLRLLAPPLQLMMASMWKVLKKRDVPNYWTLAEYVSLVVDVVPDMLMHKHRLQLLLGLRARYILELCRNDLMDRDLILSHLEKIKSCPLVNVDEPGPDIVVNFVELIHSLLKDPEARQEFFTEVFPVEYGTQYDNDLQTLFSEFIYRLNQLLPVPDMEQTVSWLGNDCSPLGDCEHSVCEPADLTNLLRHHKNLGHLEQHVPPSGMGEGILSTLSSRLTKHARSDPQQGLSDEHAVSFVDDVAVEIITVTDYSEVELSTSADKEDVRVENSGEGSDISNRAEETAAALPREPAGVGEGEEAAAQSLMDFTLPGSQDYLASPHQASLGPHDCLDCKKKFKFASSLTAHRVIHTGERPHRCSKCGRCFSFRQSLDRHRHTHKTGRKYRCACGEAFRSLPACSQRQREQGDAGVPTCRQPTPARRPKSPADDDPNANRSSESPAGHQEVAGGGRSGEVPGPDGELLVSNSSEGELRNVGDHVAEHAGAAPEHNQEATPAKVRTSGRKRKPTMKIQVLNLEKGTQRWKKSGKTGGAELTDLTSSCAEHSYGSSIASTQGVERFSAAFSCPKCSRRSPDGVQVAPDDDKVHSETEDEKLSVTDEKGRFGCPDCEKSFKFQSLLKAHRRIHTGEQPFLCPQCGCRFSFKQSLERHKLTHTSGRSYDCLICGGFFKSLLALKEHSSSHVENGEYLCRECGRAFAWKSALVRHIKTHGKDADMPESSYKCPHCQQVFSSAGYLNKHLLSHKERAHTCSCGKSFSYRAALTAHQRTHQKDRPHVCAQCGKGFLYKGGLLSHMKIHSEEKPFMCSFCGKSFKRERNMKKHERCHTRENVFCCSQCDKSFVYKATLTRHELTHSGERPFLCSDCGKGFFSHAELLKHERFHTGHKPFQCPHCGKKFTQSCYLTIHLRYHTGVRPYSCTECDKRFLSANRLKRHQRIHTGEKPYLCGECGKSFRQSYNLKMHQRTHIVKLT
eukprot:XP_011611472.1 PREDICTED: zinc finger protein 17-like [Takifugu rubripes]